MKTSITTKKKPNVIDLTDTPPKVVKPVSSAENQPNAQRTKEQRIITKEIAIIETTDEIRQSKQPAASKPGVSKQGTFQSSERTIKQIIQTDSQSMVSSNLKLDSQPNSNSTIPTTPRNDVMPPSNQLSSMKTSKNINNDPTTVSSIVTNSTSISITPTFQQQNSVSSITHQQSENNVSNDPSTIASNVSNSTSISIAPTFQQQNSVSSILQQQSENKVSNMIEVSKYFMKFSKASE